MSDVRALLKAKRQESRITHPLASYSSSGQLRCSVCAMAVKHASAWEGHLGSKGHRMNVVRVKQEEREREQKNQRQQLEIPSSTPSASLAAGDKRKSVDPDDAHSNQSSKKPRVENASNGFPNDFFSDPSQAPIISSHPDSDSDDEDDDVRMSGAPPAVGAAGAPPPTTINATPVDDEWERFQREVVNAPTANVEEDASINKQEVYARATVAVDAEMVDVTQGIPEEVAANTENTAPTEEVVLDEAELRRRKELEEKELIMDRLLEEERVQEEADMKVVQMKNRLDALKKRREMRKKQGLLT